MYSAHVNACRATITLQQTTNNSKNKKINLQCTLETSSNVTRQRRTRTNKHDVGDVDAKPVNMFMAKNVSLQRKDAPQNASDDKEPHLESRSEENGQFKGQLMQLHDECKRCQQGDRPQRVVVPGNECHTQSRKKGH